MEKSQLTQLIAVAAGRQKADVVLKNCQVVNVFTGTIEQGDIAFCGNTIAGIGAYAGHREIDAKGRFALPGLMDSHIHIESAYVSPEEFGRMVVPHGTAAVIADPHEIVNVCGLKGLEYMIQAAKGTALDVQYMLPSCVPATPFEHNGGPLDAAQMEAPMGRPELLGLGEFMNFVGVTSGDGQVVEKLLVAQNHGKPIDGHCPGLQGLALNAYVAAGVGTDHECTTVEEMQDRLARGMYVQLRQGSACHDLRKLLGGVTKENSHRCLLCSDDRQPKTIRQEGHLDGLLRICVEEGLDPVAAVTMASLNVAQCYGLKRRGAIAPGYRADVVLVEDLRQFAVWQVWLSGQLAAENGAYLLPVTRADTQAVASSVHVRDFDCKKLALPLGSSRVRVMEIQPGGVVTKNTVALVDRDERGCFRYAPDRDIVKLAVVERHQYTGNVACGLLKGYGIRRGAVALTVAHDSHNIIAAGVSDEEIAAAVEALMAQQGGMVLVLDGQVLDSMPLPIAGLMSDQSGQWVEEKLSTLHQKAQEILGVAPTVEPLMTLCFMSLPVIPELKLTDMGLFDVEKFAFVPLEAEEREILPTH